MKKSFMTIVFAATFLASCSTPSPHLFDPAGSTSAQFSKHEYECERDARNINGDSCAQMEMYEKCMRSHGYKEIQGSANKGLCSRVF